MPVKPVIDSLDGLDDALKTLYKEGDDGKFYLDVEDKDFRGEMRQVRNSNVDLNKKIAEMSDTLKRFENVDPAKYDEAMAALEKLSTLEDQDLIKDGKIDELVAKRAEKRVQQIRAETEKQITAKDEALMGATTAAEGLKKRLADTLIDSAVQVAVTKVGNLRQGAIDDVIHRARMDWGITEEGELKSNDVLNEKGDPVTSMDAWAQLLLKKASYLFEPARGGGATSGGPTNTNAGPREIGSETVMTSNQDLQDLASGKAKASV